MRTCVSPVTETPKCLSPEASRAGPVYLLDQVLGQDQGRVRPARDNISLIYYAVSRDPKPERKKLEDEELEVLEEASSVPKFALDMRSLK